MMCLAAPGRLIEIVGEGLESVGVADFGGVRRKVSLAFAPEAELGDYILAHAGVAIGRLDRAAAERALAAFAALPPAGGKS